MADRPPRRLPPSVHHLVSVFERETHAETEQASSQACFLNHQPISELADEFFSEASDRSMTEEELEEDDLLDDEEEYQKEMEDQRILDAKNGHFDRENPNPPVKPTATAEEVVAYIARSFTAETMSLDTFVVEGKGQISGNPRTGGGASLKGGGASLKGGGSGAVSDESDQPTCLGRMQLFVQPGMGDVDQSFHGGAVSDSIVLDQPLFENCLTDGCVKRACMESRQAINAKCTENQHLMPYFMENEQYQTLENGRVVGVDSGVAFVSLAPAGNRSQDLIPADSAEETHQLDLMEVRTLVNQEAKSAHARGPPTLPHAPGPAQVNSLLDHPSFPSVFPLIAQPNPLQINPQPTSHPNTPQPIPQPITVPNNPQPTPHIISSHNKKRPTATPTQPKIKQTNFNLADHLKKIINPICLVLSSQFLMPENNSPSRFLPAKNTPANPKPVHPHSLNPSLLLPAQTWRISLRSAAPIRLQQLRRLPRPIEQPLLMVFYLRLFTNHPRLLFMPRMLILHLFLGLI